MKRVVLLSLMLATMLPLWAENVATLPKPTGYIDDYANVISADAKIELGGICNEVHDKTKAQVFFVTVKTTEGEEVQTFANELFHQWKIGEKKTDRGILLLLAVNDHKRWIEVGYGFEGILNDAKAGDIGRAMVPDLQASNYDAAARLGILDVSQIIAQDAGVVLRESVSDAAPDTSQELQPAAELPASHTSPWIPCIIIPLFFCPFIGFILIARYERKRGVTFGSGSSASSGSSSDDGFMSSSGSSSDFSGGDGGDSGGGGAGGSW